MIIQRVQYALKASDNYEDRKVLHFETDSAVVLMQDGRTLEEFAHSVDGERNFTITGGVTGQARINGHDDVILEVSVGDDSHRHSGATVFVEGSNKVIISGEDGSLVDSGISAEELSYLQGVHENIQDALDNKVKESEINGNILVDGAEVVVYKHPGIDADAIVKPEEGTPPELAYQFTNFQALQGLEVDENGHITRAEVKNFKMPRFAQFYNTSIEPTDQVAGDFWLETLSVTVAPGNHYVEDVDGDLGQTQTVNDQTAVMFTMTDIDTGLEEPAAPMEDFQILEDL